MEQRQLFKNLLVTEDDSVLKRFYEQALSPLCGQLYVVESTQMAGGILEKGDIDFLITDLKLEKENGLDVVQKAVRHNEKIKILVASGDVSDLEFHDEMNGISQIKGYLQKPFTLEELTQKLEVIAGSGDTPPG